MNDNVIIETLEFTEDMYKKTLEENLFEDDEIHGMGDDANGNSQYVSTKE
ncbi:MAG: hypothetical protein IJE68_02865 [Clostridia bacterium]|nr:hypothetical protein [Clostridia bacterium]